MKKPFLTLAALLSFAGAAQAQLNAQRTSYAGVKAGGSAATFVGEAAKNERFNYGFHAGFFLNFIVDRSFSIQPELLYSMKGSKSDPAIINPTTIYLNYVDIPLAFRYQRKDLFLEAGPQVGFLISAKSSPEDGTLTGTSTFKDKFNTIDFGGLLGFGFQPQRGLGVSARYNMGFLRVRKDVPVPPVSQGIIPLRNSVIQVSVTYSLASKYR
jgi:hypothetical protein